MRIVDRRDTGDYSPRYEIQRNLGNERNVIGRDDATGDHQHTSSDFEYMSYVLYVTVTFTILLRSIWSGVDTCDGSLGMMVVRTWTEVLTLGETLATSGRTLLSV